VLVQAEYMGRLVTRRSIVVLKSETIIKSTSGVRIARDTFRQYYFQLAATWRYHVDLLVVLLAGKRRTVDEMMSSQAQIIFISTKALRAPEMNTADRVTENAV